MKITIITATYNSAVTLSDTLDSILAQTFADYEVIIQDGLSTDGTLDIAHSYESRFNGRLKIYSEKDNGLYDAMNRGINHSTGEVIGLLNSDDLYADNTILQLIHDTLLQKQTDCVFGNLKYVSYKDTDKVTRSWTGSPFRPGAFQDGWHPAHPTFYAKRECFERYGAFDTSFEVSADFELMLRFLEKHHITSCYIDYCFVKMREGGASNGKLSNIIKGNRNILRAFHKNGIPVSILYPVKRLAPKILDKIKHLYRKNKNEHISTHYNND